MTAEQAAEMLRLLEEGNRLHSDTLTALNGLLAWVNGDHGVLLLGAACVVVFACAYYVSRGLWG